MCLDVRCHICCAEATAYWEVDCKLPMTVYHMLLYILQEARGVLIAQHAWQDSAHCEHYRVHPDEYVEQLRNFTHGL